jgi:hypothetical protein
VKRVTFKELVIQNFLSIGKPVIIPLTEGITVITGKNLDKDDGNGVGKSTICDAFYFALFGETLRNITKERIVNEIAKKNCEVNLYFEIDKNGTTTKYRIERGLAPSFCRIYVDDILDDDKTRSTIPETNLYILNLINSTKAVFKNTITTSLNNSKPFMSQKKNEKREFIEGILRLEIFKAMTKVAKEKYDAIFKEYELNLRLAQENEANIKLYEIRKADHDKSNDIIIKDINNKIVDKRDIIESIKKTLVPTDASNLTEITQKEQENASILANIKVKYNSLLTNNGMLNGKKIVNDSQITKLQVAVHGFDINKLEFSLESDYHTAIHTEEDKIETAENFKLNLLDDTRDLEKENRMLLNLGDKCVTCKRPYPDQDVQQNQITIKKNNDQLLANKTLMQESIKTITNSEKLIKGYELTINLFGYQQQLKELEQINQQQIKAIKDNQTELKDLEATLTDTNTAIKALQEQKTSIKMAIQSYNYGLETIKNYEKEIIHWENSIIKIEAVKNPFDDLIKTAEAKKIELAVLIAGFKEKIAIYDVIKHIVSDEGIKSFIIKKLLGVLNERINHYLVKMDANCTLMFDEHFEDKIINDRGIECDYERFSGGERKRIDLAILFAFSDLRRLQGDVSFNLGFYDELLDSAISVECSAKVFEILKERYTEYNESSYIITHKTENLKNPNIDAIIYLVKSGGITKIKDKV